LTGSKGITALWEATEIFEHTTTSAPTSLARSWISSNATWPLVLKETTPICANPFLESPALSIARSAETYTWVVPEKGANAAPGDAGVDS
jgi:hypothetical protein